MSCARLEFRKRKEIPHHHHFAHGYVRTEMCKSCSRFCSFSNFPITRCAALLRLFAITIREKGDERKQASKEYIRTST